MMEETQTNNNILPPQSPDLTFSVPSGQQTGQQPVTQKKKELKNVFLVAGGVLVLVLSIFGFTKIKSLTMKAEENCEPLGLREENVGPNSAEIVFQTNKACLLEVVYGTSSESMLLKIPESMAALNHRIKLSPLLPETTYYYQVTLEGKKLGSVKSFLTRKTGIEEAVGKSPTPIPTATSMPVEDKCSEKEFSKYYGSANSEFDLDKNGVVNMADWLKCQQENK